MEFLDGEIQQYAQQHTSAEPTLLQKINRDTHTDVLLPRMLSGHMQGRILSLISKFIQPKYILEIGTYTGYSALCLAEGLQPNGKLVTIDINEELEDRVKSYFSDAKLTNRIDYRIGNALDVIPELSDSFDLVFIDADKENYILYYEMVIDKLKDGGVIVADNVLWTGKVLGKEKKLDKDTKALIAFNQFVQNDSRVENVLLPVEDGLMVIQKK